MKHRLLPTLLALTLALATAEPAHAQQALPNNRDKSVESAKLAYTRQIAEVKYDSLPLEEIVARLRKEFPEINFILPEELGQVIVRLEMRNVTLTEILQAIQIAGRAEYLVSEQTNERLFTFRRDDSAAQRETPKPTLRTFNLGGYLSTKSHQAQDRDAALTAQDIALAELYRLVEESWDMLQGADASLRNTPPPRLRMHSGTQMLIGVGTPEQLRFLEEIVYNLPGTTRPPVAGLPSSGGGMGATMMGGGSGMDERFLRRYGYGAAVGGEGGGGGAPGSADPARR